VYTASDRESLRDTLLTAARGDGRVTGAALTGSAAAASEDEWSDVDLAFGIAEGSLDAALADWTDRMYQQHGALHHVDVVAGATIYRVFLLRNTLQVDLAFSPASEFGATHEGTFRLLFGDATERPLTSPPTNAHLIGFGWLYALHARSCLRRQRLWQAEYMISGVRDHVLALACLRHGLPAVQGRGIDRLPAGVTGPLVGALVASLDVDELWRAFGVATEGLRVEIRESDPDLARRLQPALRELASGAPGGGPPTPADL
jgi:hypothetical protein